MYRTEALIQEAIAAGFSQAGELNIAALVFMPEVREMCRADRCQQYGKNWCCPPGCGSIEQAAKRAAAYSYGILVQTIGKLGDDFDYETIQATSEKHMRDFAALAEALRSVIQICCPWEQALVRSVRSVHIQISPAVFRIGRFLPWKPMACGSVRFASCRESPTIMVNKQLHLPAVIC